MSRQSKIKIEKIRGNDINVESSFKYIKYSSEENLRLESKIAKISNGDIKDSMYIDFVVDINTHKNSNNNNNTSINDSLKTRLDSLSKLEGNAEEFALFNKLKRNENLILFVKDISKEKDLDVINSFLGLDAVSAMTPNFKDYIESSKNIVLNSNVKNNIVFQNRINPEFNDSIENVIFNYEKLYENKFDLEKSNNIESLFSNFLAFNKRSIYNQEASFETSTDFIGIYIEKFVKIDDKYEKIASKYLMRESIQTASEEHSFRVEDGHIKYGKTYRYAIFPVYLVSLPTFEDFHTVDQFIICNVPYITNDILCKEFTRPDPPQMIFFNYYKNKKSLKIEWQSSISEQGDVKGYQIFKRNSLDEPYKLLKQIEFHSTFDHYERNKNVLESTVFKTNEVPVNEFFDTEFDTSKINIYTICSIDAHGYVSNYSVQLGVVYDFIQGKCIVDTISRQGAPLNYPNLLVPRKTMFIDNENKLVNITPKKQNFKKATLYITPEYKEVSGLTDEEPINILNDNYRLNILRLDNFKIISHNIQIKK